MRAEMDRSLEPIENGAYHVHADSAPGDRGDLRCRAKAGLENEPNRVLLGNALELLGLKKSLFNRALFDGVQVDAAPVIFDFNDHLGALMISVEIDGAARGLALRNALVRRLDAVIDGIADHVHERLGEGVEDAFVEIGVLAGQFESDVLAALFGYVADDAGKATEKLLDRDHADLQHAL